MARISSSASAANGGRGEYSDDAVAVAKTTEQGGIRHLLKAVLVAYLIVSEAMLCEGKVVLRGGKRSSTTTSASALAIAGEESGCKDCAALAGIPEDHAARVDDGTSRKLKKRLQKRCKDKCWKKRGERRCVQGCIKKAGCKRKCKTAGNKQNSKKRCVQVCFKTQPALANTVVDAPDASDSDFGDPTLAVNGVRGGGINGQSTDVYSIQDGGHLTISFGGRRARNGPGVDFAVFENPFEFGGGQTFMDQTIVELSIDGKTWVKFPHDYVAADETTYSNLQADWIGFAGVGPVLLHNEDNPVDPFDAEAAGGNQFDLDDLPRDGEAGRIRKTGFVYLRLSPASDFVNPDTGLPFPRDAFANGPDVDGAWGRYVDAK